ncbi:glycosyltransferase family 2 protein [Pantanalinema rosaneae CENA516]|uniref:glycosyltransferase family 2 protein n=1 Tax=Pantanalinema rosaneae TaxID=1620701 RepID=UPI003D6DEA0F
MNISVALIIFKRPDLTKKVFERIRQAKPKTLFVIADAPRPERPEEVDLCTTTRAIIDSVDWTCEVVKNYAEINLGCRLRLATGISWVFDQVEDAIILEDDCLPHPSFFQFCQELLERYRDDERIMMISGTNYAGEWKSKLQSYHFSYYGGIWGWASWRRAWKYYDDSMHLWTDQHTKDLIRDLLCDKEQFEAREKLFDSVLKREIDTWDYVWSFARLSQSGLSIVPSINLVSNLGFGLDATHTTNSNSHLSRMKVNPLKFPLQHNNTLIADRDYDRYLFRSLYNHKKVFRKILYKLTKLLESNMPE